jgi:dTDP-4-amino-4,6-dideoxygalactose transaminase
VVEFQQSSKGILLHQPSIPLFKVFMADSVKDAVVRVLYSGYIGEGEEVQQFEHELAARIGTPAVLTVNSGTSALHLAYHICTNGAANSEIITTPITCTATNMPILQNGARIVWAGTLATSVAFAKSAPGMGSR